MMIANKLHWNTTILALLISTCAQAYPGESIVLDPASGDYTITYRSGDPTETRMMQTTFVPATKIAPAIRSVIRVREQNNGIVYRYSVSNGATAKQPIVGVWIENVVNPIIGELSFPHGAASEAAYNAYNAATVAATSTPTGWYGDIIRDLSRIAWSPNVGTTFSGGGVQPGQSQSGFGFASLDLPGISETHLVGTGAMFGYPDEGPAEDSSILAELERMRDNDFIAKQVAVPAIVVPVPFDAALLLDRVRTEMQTWSSKQLLDASYSAKLDAYLSSAANAFRMNQAKVAREQIETVRKLLEKEHHYIDRDDEDREDTEEHKQATRFTIDRLAARVLDFDLRYVLKRTEREHEREHEEKGEKPHK